MPTLNWIGKEKVVNHHQDVPYKILEHKYNFSIGCTDKACLVPTGNKIIHGDNLEALKSLLPEYEGKIKCIYIDPPYNTGNEGWVYNDNVNDPKIKKWLEQTLKAKEEGKTAAIGIDDLTRHDKWLCMMYPRLKLLHKLLSDDGAIFISIDDNELAHLKLVMDEIFGANNFIEYFSWIKTSTAPSLAKKTRKTTEYVLCYEKKKSNRKYKAEEGDGGDAPLLNSGNNIVELIFPKETVTFKIKDGNYKIGQYDRLFLNNEITITKGFSDKEIKLSGEFKWTQNTLNDEIKSGTTFIVKSEKFAIRYLRETETYKAPTNLLKEKYFTTLIDKKDAGVETNEGAKKEIIEIFGKSLFDYPKPTSLIEFFIKLIDDKNSIVLDSFAGSGTTAHAVINLNKQDNGNRKFILVEMEDYAETITAERVKRVMKQQLSESSKLSESLTFDFYELGKPMFIGDNNEFLNPDVETEKIREYIYYSETRKAIESEKLKVNSEKYFLGKENETAYYFYYEKEEITALNLDFLKTIKVKAEQYVIYADNCLLSKEFMQKKNIIFKKIPRDISKI